MSSSMRRQARSLVGMTVVAQHVSGIHYHGVLHSVNEKGIYLMNAHALQHMSSKTTELHAAHAISGPNEIGATEAFFPFFFLPFVALTGLAAASAAAHGPYGPYGYGYGPYGPYGGGYGGYGGYGGGYGGYYW